MITPFQEFKKILGELDKQIFNAQKERNELKEEIFVLEGKIKKASVTYDLNEDAEKISHLRKDLNAKNERLETVSTVLDSLASMSEKQRKVHIRDKFPKPELKKEIEEYNSDLVEKAKEKASIKKTNIINLRAQYLKEVRELGLLHKEYEKLSEEINEVRSFFGSNIYFDAGVYLGVNQEKKAGFIYLDYEVHEQF